METTIKVSQHLNEAALVCIEFSKNFKKIRIIEKDKATWSVAVSRETTDHEFLIKAPDLCGKLRQMLQARIGMTDGMADRQEPELTSY